MKQPLRSSRTSCAKPIELLLIAALAMSARASSGSPGGGPAAWSVFAPPGAGFAVELPGTPAVERDSHWTPVGSISMTKYWLRVGDALLAVELHELPPVAAALVSDDRILDEARENLLRDVRGTLIESRATEFQGAPARDFRYRLPGPARLEEQVLAVIVETRLYLITGMARAPASDPEVARFFGSFHYQRQSGTSAVTP
jgi:hypothetical protein